MRMLTLYKQVFVAFLHDGCYILMLTSLQVMMQDDGLKVPATLYITVA